MKSNEAREMMVERVQAAYAKWPNFYALPDGVKSDYSVAVNETLLLHAPAETYAKALYAAAYRGEPIGRLGMTISVRKVVEKPI
jgi:hypothetical protein